MKFKSRKDWLFALIIYGLILFFIFIFVLDWTQNGIESNDSWRYIVMMAVTVFLLWIFYGTKYELSKNHLKYNCGPINGKIELKKINQIIKEKSLWSGLRPATARNGLIIKYEKYNDIYISPKTNETFIKKILELNSSIEIKTD